MNESPATRRRRALLVEDEEAVRALEARILQGGGFDCQEASDVASALSLVDLENFDVIVIDMGLPGRSGLSLVEQLTQENPHVATLVVTGQDDNDVAREATRRGGCGYLLKPFDSSQLLVSVSTAIEQAAARMRHRERERELQDMVELRAERALEALSQLEQAEGDVKRVQRETLRRLSLAAEYRQPETASHFQRVGNVSAILALRAGLPSEKVADYRDTAGLHDVGMIAVPDAVLHNPGALTPDEFKVMKRHCETGHDILSNSGIPVLDLAAEIALTHHERFDGSGYPHGLSGEDIPIAGRIVAIADVYDALSSDRPYRPRLPFIEAIQTMIDGSGTSFDPSLLDLLLRDLQEVIDAAGGG